MHFNVQAIGHLIVLKVKRIPINGQHIELFTFQNQLLGQVSGQVITFMINLLKKFNPNPEASYREGFKS